jgi:hypothetical protein
MKAIWVPFGGSGYLVVDKVALAHTAAALLPLLPTTDLLDSYGLDHTLRPLLDRAIKFNVDAPILDRSGVIGAKYFYERREGALPKIFTPEFNSALSRFLVRAMSMPLEEPKLRTINGKVCALMQIEEPGDWPDNVVYE